MPAPKGNKFWEFRDFFGRQKEFTPQEWHQKVVDYCEWHEKRTWEKKEAVKSGALAGELVSIPTTPPMSIKGLCLFAGIDRKTFNNYESAKGYEDYFLITAWARDIIENQQFEGASVGTYNANIIARVQGLTEKTDITTNGNEIKQVNVTELISGFMGKKEGE